LRPSVLALFCLAACHPPPAGPVGQPIPRPELPLVDQGKSLFSSLRCANCHGPEGRGSELFPGAPTLVGRTAEDLEVSLVKGCPANDPSCHPLKLTDITEHQRLALEAYFASLAGGSRLENPGPPCDATPGRICTIAGTGVAGNKRQANVLAREAFLFWPQNVTVDPQDRLVITDWNNYLIRRLEKTGCVDGDCPMVSLLGNGTLADECSTAARPVMARQTGNNHNITVDYDRHGHLLLSGWHMWKIKLVEMLPQGEPGRVFCLFGNGRGFGGDGMAAGFGGPSRFNLPSAVVQDDAGNFYIADQGNVRIRKVSADADDVDVPDAAAYVASRQNNVVTTWIGGPLDAAGHPRRTSPDYSDSGDEGPIAGATLGVDIGFDATPQFRMAIDNPRKRLYIADSNNHRIRMVDMSVDPPIIRTAAGGGTNVTGSDIPATEARLNRPADVDLAADGSGDLLITDTYNHCVRLLDFKTQRVRTLAGVCGPDKGGYSGDGGPGTAALLFEPGGSYLARDRTLYIADTENHRIRKVNP
jgi:mono/diheme cytochrome c family protein